MPRTHFAQTAIELRHDRLCGVPSPWEHQPCVYCYLPRSLNGRHLLQCPCLPANLLEQRTLLIAEYYPQLSLSHFVQATVACVGAQDDDATSPRLVFLRKSLALGRKIMRHARQAMRLAAEAEQEVEDSGSALAELFQEEVSVEDELVDSFPPACSLQSLNP